MVDVGYTNYERFLALYRGQRYHLNEWREGRQPTNLQEYFNKKHATTRNVIEMYFGMLKLHWAILRSSSFYLIRTHNCMIIVCYLLHNLIRREDVPDPLKAKLNVVEASAHPIKLIPITKIKPSDAWNNWLDGLAYQMFNEFWGQRAS